MEYELTLLVLTIGFAAFMAWGIGANDIANAMGTSVGAKALTIKQAIWVAAIFEFSGAILAGGEVTGTIRKGIVNPLAFAEQPEMLVYGMLASMLAAASWLAIATARGWPVSTTHSIVGAIIGFSIVVLGVNSVAWPKVGLIVASWVASPLCAGLLSLALMLSIKKLIIERPQPLAMARRYAPIYCALTVFILALLTLSKGLKHIAWAADFDRFECYLIAIFFALLGGALGWLLIQRVQKPPAAAASSALSDVERLFGALMIITACGMAFAHGSNDVANAIGPAAAILSVLETGSVDQNAPIPVWILFLGGAGIVLGLVTFGRRVIATVGERITRLTPTRGFAAEIGACSTVVLASSAGIPISTTHALVGAVLGVGLADGINAIDLKVVGKIIASWLVTVPAGALFSIIIFYILRAIFSA